MGSQCHILYTLIYSVFYTVIFYTLEFPGQKVCSTAFHNGGAGGSANHALWCLFQDHCFALEQDGADLKAAKEASEQKIQEFEKEAEHLCEKLEKDTLLSSELAASYQVWFME